MLLCITKEQCFNYVRTITLTFLLPPLHRYSFYITFPLLVSSSSHKWRNMISILSFIWLKFFQFHLWDVYFISLIACSNGVKNGKIKWLRSSYLFWDNYFLFEQNTSHCQPSWQRSLSLFECFQNIFSQVLENRLYFCHGDLSFCPHLDKIK